MQFKDILKNMESEGKEIRTIQERDFVRVLIREVEKF